MRTSQCTVKEFEIEVRLHILRLFTFPFTFLDMQNVQTKLTDTQQIVTFTELEEKLRPSNDIFSLFWQKI